MFVQYWTVAGAAAMLAGFVMVSPNASGPWIRDRAVHVPDEVALPRVEYLEPFAADHEIYPELGLIVYQSGPDVVLAELDARTGRLANGAGADWHVDTGADPLSISKNGPEFGIDRDGWSIFYNRQVDGRSQVWRATPSRAGPDGGFDTAVLTTGAYQRINQLPSQDPGASETFVVYARGNNTGNDNNIVYLSDEDPEAETIVTPISPLTAGFRWIDGTSLMVSTDSSPNDFGQILLIDAVTGQREIITDDPGIKFDPYAWFAPDGALHVVAAVNNAMDLAVYRETPIGAWDRISVLPIPVESGMTYVQSPEPFTVGNQSFIITTLKDDPGKIGTDVSEAEVWIYGIDDDPQARFTLRCDDGQPGRIRHEGEVFLGENELFVYYNELIRGESVDLYLCRTGIRIPSIADTQRPEAGR